jgi:hypothetical protein
MKKDPGKTGKLVALFFLFLVLMNYPVLSLFNRPVLILGIPLLFMYIFCTWLLLIVLVAFTISRQPQKNDQQENA